MSDAALQALLDPDGQGRGIRILRRVDEFGDTLSAYYVDGGQDFAGRSRWIQVTKSDSDAQKDTAIRANLAIP